MRRAGALGAATTASLLELLGLAPRKEIAADLAAQRGGQGGGRGGGEQIYFPYAERDGLGLLARVPLASGLLSGKYKPGTTFAGNDVRAKFDAEKLKRDLAEVDRLAQTEVPAGVPMAQWAMAWCLQNPLVTAIIPGSKNPAQVRANATAADLLTA